ncbi:MAG: magnesium transporter [Phycisphaeraceae bacterium]|nr:magnesium transporter [Phycisphaeraceae bacterium]
MSPPDAPPTEPVADRASLIEAIEAGSAADCQAWLEQASSDDAIHALAQLGDAERSALLSLLSPELAAEVLDLLPRSQAVDALEELDAPIAANIVEELWSDERADLIRELDAEDAEAILTELDEATVADIRKLTSYDDDEAGSLMHTEYLAFADHTSIRELLSELERGAEEYAGYNIQYTYVVDAANRLVGVLPLRNVVLARRTASVRDVMIADPIDVTDRASLDDVRALFKEHPFLGLPVVDTDRRLVGVIEAGDVARAEVEQADARYRQAQGIIGGEELRSMPLAVRCRRRLAWLSMNIGLNILAASAIAIHQDTLEAVIALAVFLPIISDMSGCSGNQAVAVTMRELTIGVTRPRDALRVLVKEGSLGVINGVALGFLIGLVAYLWKGNLVLGAVVGSALALNTLIAVCVGGLIPLLLKRFKADPALASGPILTTLTDLCGFVIVLSLASMVLQHLT